MKKIIFKVTLFIATFMAIGGASAQTKTIKFVDFAKNLEQHENTTVIVRGARAIQNHSIAQSDGSVTNLVGLNPRAARFKDKKLTPPLCPYKNGYTEVRIQGFDYCVVMKDDLHKKFRKELDRSQGDRVYDFIIDGGDRNKGFTLSGFSNLGRNNWTK